MGGAVKSIGSALSSPIATILNPVGALSTKKALDVGGAAAGAVGIGQNKVDLPSAVNIDEEAFKLKNADATQAAALKQRKLAEDRSQKQAQRQQALLDQLSNQASGQTPSLATAQMKAAQDRSLAQQLALAGRSQGGNAASTQRQLARAGSQAARGIAQDSAQARLQEQNQAQQLLAQVGGQEQAQADQLVGNFLQQGFNIDQAKQRAAQALQTLKVDQVTGLRNAALQQQATQAQQQGALLGAAGAALPIFASDKNLKKDIKKADADIPKFLKALEAKHYNYKDEKHGQGGQTGILAQDLVKSKIGKQMVINTPEGKMVDMKKGFGAVLAAQANLNKRLEKIESKKSKK